MKRIYGDESTHLTLTDKARKYYDGVNPVRITEHVTLNNDGSEEYLYTYMEGGGPETGPMTADELNQMLEAVQDDIDSEYEISFEAGESRHGDYGVNFMLAMPGKEFYAECAVPEGADEDFGYMALKAEIIRQAVEQGIAPEQLTFWYDGQEEHLSDDARVEGIEVKGW